MISFFATSIVCFATFFALDVCTTSGSAPPRVFTINAKALVTLKKQMRESPGDYSGALAAIQAEADALLTTPPWTITNKTILPPSGDPHDYESQGPYWWPDPASADGLPYIRRDGEVNPEIKELKDHDHMTAMISAVRKLALAYYLSEEERYAAKASSFLRTWFIDRDTRMNPHLNFGQRIPGRTDGRDIGIIETRNLGDVTDAVGLLHGSSSWTGADQAGMLSWMGQYLDWLLHSKHGKGEARQHNNHGSWYDVQVASLAFFTGQDEIAQEAIVRARDKRMPGHIARDGSQPHELARTRSWDYSVMNLQSFFTLATLADAGGIGMWHHTSDGRSIRAALDFLVAFSGPENSRQWPYRQIKSWNAELIVPLLRQADCHFPDAGYGALADRLGGDPQGLHRLLYPCSCGHVAKIPKK